MPSIRPWKTNAFTASSRKRQFPTGKYRNDSISHSVEQQSVKVQSNGSLQACNTAWHCTAWKQHAKWHRQEKDIKTGVRSPWWPASCTHGYLRRYTWTNGDQEKTARRTTPHLFALTLACKGKRRDGGREHTHTLQADQHGAMFVIFIFPLQSGICQCSKFRFTYPPTACGKSYKKCKVLTKKVYILGPILKN